MGEEHQTLVGPSWKIGKAEDPYCKLHGLQMIARCPVWWEEMHSVQAHTLPPCTAPPPHTQVRALSRDVNLCSVVEASIAHPNSINRHPFKNTPHQ